MRQFDVFPNPESRFRKKIPYLVVLQSDLLQAFDNVVVAPLRSLGEGNPMPILRLNPTLEIEGERLFVRVQDLAAIPARALTNNPVANLAHLRTEIVSALDMLFQGL